MFFFQTTFYFFNYKISFQILAQDNNTFWMIFIEFRDKKVWKKPPRAQILHYFCYQFRKNKNITIHVNTQYFLSMYHRKRITKKNWKTSCHKQRFRGNCGWLDERIPLPPGRPSVNIGPTRGGLRRGRTPFFHGFDLLSTQSVPPLVLLRNQFWPTNPKVFLKALSAPIY